MKIMFLGSFIITILFFYMFLGLQPINPFGVLSLKIIVYIGGLIPGCFWGLTASLFISAGRKAG